MLSPLRFHYDTPTFNLPVRLGPANSARHDRVLLRLRSTAQRDPGYQPGYPNNFNAASKCPPHRVSARRGVLWTTTLTARYAYVTLLSGASANHPSVLRVRL